MSICTRCFSELSALAVFCPSCEQANAPAFDHLLNQTVADRYHIQKRFTGGGLSAVFLALDLQTNVPVVLKFSDPQHLTRREITYALDTTTARAYWSEMLERMRHEAEMLLSLRHPHIVKLHDTGTLNDNLRFLALEYLEGVTLREALLRQPRQSLPEAIRLTLTLADALAHVHARGIVHRDLNPRNVMLCGKERIVKLIDFGIAKFPQPPGAPPFTQHSLLHGTVAYASPEQCQNGTLDARSDLYSLGVMLYEMATGQKPFNGRTPTEIALQQIQAIPEAPRKLNEELTPDLQAFILRTLAKQPVDRPASAAAFAAELRAASRRIVIEFPAAVVPATIAAPPASFHFTSFERAAAPRKMLVKTMAATATLALMLAAATGSPELSRWLNRFSATNHTPLVVQKSNEAESPSPSTSSVRAAAGSAEQNSPDAFESMTQPLRADSSANSWATALSAKATLPRFNKNQAANVPKALSSTAKTPPAPFVMPASFDAVNGTAPPYAFPSASTVFEAPTTTVVTYSDDHLTTSIDQATAPPTPIPAVNHLHNPTINEARDDEAWRPRLISWNGYVSGERLLRIELPGQPGMVEIPPAFRHRVGIIEPPQPANDWRCVRLRVIGRGAVNLVIRWWPK